MNHQLLNGSTLAYLGDAVYSLMVREYLIQQGYTKAKDLQEKSIKYVSAKAQAKIYDILEKNNFFEQQELEIFKRGRNFKSGSVPKNTDVVTYRISTGIEALIGYWYLEKNEERMKQFWEKVRTIIGE